MPRLNKKFSVLVVVLLTVIFTVAWGINRPVTGDDQTEILWDTWGVPHIYGNNIENLFQGFGWAQAASHGNLILQLYGQARGKAAEYWGQDYLDSDKYVRTMGIPTRAQEWYEAQDPTMRRYLDSFAAGINRYASEHDDQIDDKVKVVLPVDGVDVLAHLQRVTHFNFVVNPQRLESLKSGESQAGSNGWAIAPSHSASGNAMLLANPHLPWSNFYLWYEAQLTAPGIDAYGAALVGMPMFSIAFNDHLGWTATVNTHRGWTAYQLTLADGGYEFDGQVRPFESETQTLKVKQENGTIKEEELVIRRSIHGAVVTQQEGNAIALRVVGLDQPQLMAQLWDMVRSRNRQEFETAVARLQLPMFTILYADRDGHILHIFNGQVPVRSQGDWQYWQGVVPGDTSETLWTKYHPYSDLPRILDPETGWLQNANDPPWTTTFPQRINPDDYPPYMAPQSMNFRAQGSAKMLMAENPISFEQMIAKKFSSRLELADRILDDLIAATRQSGDKLANEAANVLANWDRQANADSRGTVLFATWVQLMPNNNQFATSWNPQSPLTTPDSLADPVAAVKTLAGAAARVKSDYGRLDVPWGERARLKYGDVDLPGSGASGQLGSFQVIDFAPMDETKLRSVAGDSYIAAIEFSDPVKARVLTVYGNATQPGSGHIGDQLALYARHELRPVWRTRQDIEAHLESRTVF